MVAGEAGRLHQELPLKQKPAASAHQPELCECNVRFWEADKHTGEGEWTDVVTVTVGP